ncbi:type 1 glutamine amidotransferase domain-containing protein [Paenalkalicoccus suaedae]|uniref:Type 1 glutamine amidotransferase domain-containing protein n=1 Tax=Paenalkalicoccus suaedae TaxID=2592382 RepID=A0A859FJC8_9BACI|nr:type 1 glutamine amidotransferase domain-containing protein [Paenalkalicoccus suaedae]QKS72886.1 type 1 glutamine amidotransferase domain-containing protein [Paenalkalicoccus suaedae]
MTKKVLMVLTSEAKMGGDNNTGLWLEEFAAPYVTFVKAGFDVKVVSIAGGQVPLDPNSLPEESQLEWQEAESKLANTEKLSEEDVSAGYDAVFLPGGHGTVYDYPDNLLLQRLLRETAENDRVIGSVCHGPSGLIHATYADGTPIVKGKKVTAFTDSEEKEMGLENVVPFLLESTLRDKGADFVNSDNWADFSVRDGNLVTGQNPQSSQSTADKVVEALS